MMQLNETQGLGAITAYMSPILLTAFSLASPECFPLNHYLCGCYIALLPKVRSDAIRPSTIPRKSSIFPIPKAAFVNTHSSSLLIALHSLDDVQSIGLHGAVEGEVQGGNFCATVQAEKIQTL